MHPLRRLYHTWQKRHLTFIKTNMRIRMFLILLFKFCKRRSMQRTILIQRDKHTAHMRIVQMATALADSHDYRRMQDFPLPEIRHDAECIHRFRINPPKTLMAPHPALHHKVPSHAAKNIRQHLSGLSIHAIRCMHQTATYTTRCPNRRF